MDRNIKGNPYLQIGKVALRKESVDRNIPVGTYKISAPVVALRKESVDRNRRWRLGRSAGVGVALRKESVDRNQSIRGI